MGLRIDLDIEGNDERQVKILKAILGPNVGRMTAIDLFCGHADRTPMVKFKDIVHVDVLPMTMKWPGSKFQQADIFKPHPVFDARYDAALALDAIEHIGKADGPNLIRRMAEMSIFQILFTPLGEWCVNPASTNPEEHKCGWMPEELEAMGFGTIVCPRWHPTWNVGAFYAFGRPSTSALSNAQMDGVRDRLSRSGLT